MRMTSSRKTAEQLVKLPTALTTDFCTHVNREKKNMKDKKIFGLTTAPTLTKLVLRCEKRVGLLAKNVPRNRCRQDQGSSSTGESEKDEVGKKRRKVHSTVRRSGVQSETGTWGEAGGKRVPGKEAQTKGGRKKKPNFAGTPRPKRQPEEGSAVGGTRHGSTRLSRAD